MDVPVRPDRPDCHFTVHWAGGGRLTECSSLPKAVFQGLFFFSLTETGRGKSTPCILRVFALSVVFGVKFVEKVDSSQQNSVHFNFYHTLVGFGLKDEVFFAKCLLRVRSNSGLNRDSNLFLSAPLRSPARPRAFFDLFLIIWQTSLLIYKGGYQVDVCQIMLYNGKNLQGRSEFFKVFSKWEILSGSEKNFLFERILKAFRYLGVWQHRHISSACRGALKYITGPATPWVLVWADFKTWSVLSLRCTRTQIKSCPTF